MAHLRGLLCEFEGPGYIVGVREYLQLVEHLMKGKSYSGEMISLALSRYRTNADILERRLEAEAFAASAFSLTPTHLEAIVASPLADGGQRLDRFLAWRHSDRKEIWPNIRQTVTRLAVSSINGDHLTDHGADLHQGYEFLKEATGMDESSLRLIARRRTSSGRTTDSTDALGVLRKGDPHKMELLFSKIDVNRIITGR